MAKVPHGVETLPKIWIAWVGRTNVKDDRQTTDDRRTDGRRHIANMNLSSRSLKMLLLTYLFTYKGFICNYRKQCPSTDRFRWIASIYLLKKHGLPAQHTIERGVVRWKREGKSHVLRPAFRRHVAVYTAV